uniref:N-acetylgalactosaminide beta-1,3-galactosyltransferase n=1 Tax=Caligus clemensi TaxID=344056 RepID=C1C363_CALCM|nr:Glycoprotein-N-acetylgalactosamine 3-beta-galactosyltransferase 1 [Caligus clemensi]
MNIYQKGMCACLSLTVCFLILTKYSGKSFFPLQKYLAQAEVSENSTTRLDDDWSSIRIICIVLTHTHNHESRAQAVKQTWGKRCKSLIFVTNSTTYLADVNVYSINRTDTYRTIWGKTKEGLAYAYNLFKDDADWFLKADDDTFIVMENLQLLIAERKAKPEDPTWFGLHYRLYAKYGYMAGGGYLLSKESTKRFVEQALKSKNPLQCKVKSNDGYEDLEMGKCLASVGVQPGDSRDEYLRSRMFCFNAEMVLNPEMPDKTLWFWKYIKHPQVFGHPGCCSDKTISYHYVTEDKMYLYNYLAYNSFVHGESNQDRKPPSPETLVQNMDINWTKIRSH